MEKKQYFCDSCTKEIPDFKTEDRICMPVGWESDPAGGHGSENIQYFDICPRCMALAINALLKNNFGYDYNADLARRVIGGHGFSLCSVYKKTS